MERAYILLSWLNDFIFCPHSIYLHEIYGNSSRELYQGEKQWKGSIAHESLDEQRYSTRKDVISGLAVLSTELMLHGKIDLYKGKSRELIERKKKIKVVYDGYVYQLLGQYYCMVEMGYVVEKLCLYSLDDNKKYNIALPDEMKRKEFCAYLERIRSYRPGQPLVSVNPNKCRHCIYSELCEQEGEC